MKRVLVTGAAGFIGGHFVEHYCDFQKGAGCALDKITYASNPDTLRHLLNGGIPFYQADICDTSTVVNACVANDINVILNFAAETHVDNSIRDCGPFIESNVIGVRSLLEVCRRLKIPMVHISTDEVYGPATYVRFDENDRLNPKNPYAATKASAEHLIDSYRNTYGISCAVLRPSNNFGPRQNEEKFIPKLMAALVRQKQFPLYGDGLHTREWLYVKDCVRIISDLIQLDLGNQTINIGNPESELTNLQVCETVFRRLIFLLEGQNIKDEMAKIVKFVPDRPGHDRRYAISTDKLRSLLPKIKYTSFDDAIRETTIEGTC